MSTATSSIVWKTPAASGSVVSNKPISDMLQALVASGTLTQTADTGQVSWGSVAATAVSQDLYEIYRLHDSLDSTYPIFIKIIYSLVVTSQQPLLKVQIGTGSDGVGNLTGATSAITIRGAGGVNAAPDTNNTACYASAGEGYLNLFGGCNGTLGATCNGGFAFSLERMRDSAGAILGPDGVAVVCSPSAEAASAVSYSKVGGSTFTHPSYSPYIDGCFAATRANLPNLFLASNCVWPPVCNRGGSWYASPQFDGTNYLAAAIQPYAGKLCNPMTAALLVDDTFPQFSNPVLSMYGAAHTYQTLNPNLPAPTAGKPQTLGSIAFAWQLMATHLAFRFE